MGPFESSWGLDDVELPAPPVDVGLELELAATCGEQAVGRRPPTGAAASLLALVLLLLLAADADAPVVVVVVVPMHEDWPPLKLGAFF